jgi:CRISPR-associated protein Csm4
MKAIKIKPGTNFKIVPRSDTLWGMIMCAYKKLYGEEEFQVLLMKFADNVVEVPFVMSSCFYYEESNSEEHFFLPKPKAGAISFEIQDVETMSYLKEFKKAKFLEKNDFEQLINSTNHETVLFQRFVESKNEEVNVERRNSGLQRGISSLGKRMRYSETFNMHNSIDRMSGSTLMINDSGQLYWEEETAFAKNSGIYFLVEGDVDPILPCLRYLSHIGLGGNSSIGKGAFDFEVVDFEIRQPEKANSQVTLSLYSPIQSELKAIRNSSGCQWYDLVIRQGFTGRDFNESVQKNSCVVFGEGSSFAVSEKLHGRLLKTARIQNFDVYNNYLTLTVNSL